MSQAGHEYPGLNPSEHTVLVVDDSSANITMLTDYLEDSGFRILVAMDGEQALQVAVQAHPDLILLDVVMPGIDGFETCRQLKTHAVSREIPVIFMTALSSTEDKVRGFQMGAVDYVTKPFRQEEILARVSTHLQIRNLTRTLQRANEDLSQALTNLKATQNQLIETEKMAALSGLVSGIAHTINTPLGIGVTAASALELETRTLREAYQRDRMTRSGLEAYLSTAAQSSQLILDNLLRAADLVRSFKQVAVDQSTIGARVFLVRSCAEDVVRSLKSKLEQSKLTFLIEGDETISMNSYPGVLSQILTNLIINSMTHAYPDSRAGQLSLRLQKHEQRLLLYYTDDGCGMPAEHLHKIFDPFFTTARNRGGIGLGMYIVYNLVTQKLHGTIHCESQVGAGTKFILDLPLQ